MKKAPDSGAFSLLQHFVITNRFYLFAKTLSFDRYFQKTRNNSLFWKNLRIFSKHE